MLLRELFEGGSKHVTFCFGRMNPPTIGHEQVFKTMESVGGDYFIFVSQSQDKKENPLSYSEKIKFIKAIHEKYSDHVIEDSSVNTVVKAASYLYDQGYTDATFVAGSDRIEQFKKLLTQYNGVEGKSHGYYKFNVLDFTSSGEREDGAEGVAGVSASGARLAAANNDLEAFTKATGAGQYAKPMFDAVRQGMGISENIEQIDELAGEEDYYKFILGKLKLGRPLTKREQEFLKTYRLMHKTEDIDMRIAEILEHKKSRKAKTYNVKPRNPVAHAAQTTISGSGAHKDKKKAAKQGEVKHKGKVDERVRDPEDWDEGNTEPPNNFAIYINGKKWKVFPGHGTYADDERERAQYYKLKDWARRKSEATGKKWEVYVTGEPATESMDEGWKDKLAAAALAGTMAMGAGNASARVSGDEDPSLNRLTGKPIATQVAPSDSPKQDVVPLSSRYDSKYQGSPEAYTIKVDGKLYKFAGRTADAPGNGEKIKVPAGAVGIRGLAPVTVELGSDGTYYHAPSN